MHLVQDADAPVRRDWMALAQRHRVLLAAVFLLIFPLLMPFKAIAVNILIYGLFALGFNMLYGYAGLLSFGHSALLGAGAYACGIALTRFGLPWWLGVILATCAGMAMAAVMGALAVRTRGIYFAMVTLALSQCVYYIALQATDWTGGENGLRGIRLTQIGPLDFVDPTTRYYVVAVIVIAALFVLSRILASPFGAVLEAVRENEARARACGFDVRATRLLAFTLSGAFCGLAGALQALHLGIVPLETLSYQTSGQAVMMALLGGMGTFFGP
ncbi:MAG: branched-chain amino acid ABC transporter permease, partial [Pseudomonadota bacterium]|nr:branched-chain amino acid ABC transporter permease [Pseudomonadota bacterium]